MKLQLLRKQCSVRVIDSTYHRRGPTLHAIIQFLEQRRLALLLLYSTCYFAGVCVHAYWRPLWYDEFFTYYLSKLTLSELSVALASGVDLTPPLLHVLTKGAHAVLGDNNIATRGTAIIGFWIASLCVFVYARRRTSALFGFIALCGMFVTLAYQFAFEARSYGLLLCFTGLSLVCWQRAGERDSSLPWWTLGAAVSLIGLVASHLYGLFVVSAFAGAEAIREIRLRSVHFAMWIALLCSGLPLLLLREQLASARAYSTNFWARGDWPAFVGTYHLFVTSGIVAIVVAMLVMMLFAYLAPPQGEVQELPRIPLEEIVLPIAFPVHGKQRVTAHRHTGVALP